MIVTLAPHALKFVFKDEKIHCVKITKKDRRKLCIPFLKEMAKSLILT